MGILFVLSKFLPFFLCLRFFFEDFCFSSWNVGDLMNFSELNIRKSANSQHLENDGSMGRTVYLPTWINEWLILYGKLVGKYTFPPMDDAENG